MTVSRTKGSVLFAFGCIIMCKKNKYSSGCYICSHFSFPSRLWGARQRLILEVQER